MDERKATRRTDAFHEENGPKCLTPTGFQGNGGVLAEAVRAFGYQWNGYASERPRIMREDAIQFERIDRNGIGGQITATSHATAQFDEFLGSLTPHRLMELNDSTQEFVNVARRQRTVSAYEAAALISRMVDAIFHELPRYWAYQRCVEAEIGPLEPSNVEIATLASGFELPAAGPWQPKRAESLVEPDERHP